MRGNSAWPFLLALTFSSLGIGISLPIVPLFAVELGAGGFAIGLIVSLRWASRLVVDIPVGTASEHHGRRRIFVWGIALVAVSGLVSAVAPRWEVLLIARVIEGVGAGMSGTAGLAAVADLSTPATRARYLSGYQASQRIGFWFGPLIGGVVGAAVDLRTALWAYFVFAAVAVIPALLVKETRVADAAARISSRAGLRLLARNRDFLLIGAVSFIVFFTMTGAQFTALPLFATAVIGMDAGFVGLVLFLSNTVGFLLLYPSGVMSDRYSRKAIIVVLLAATVVGLALLGLATDPAWIVVACLAMGGGNALRGPAMQAYVMDAGRGGGHGATAGAFRAIGDLGSTLGPVVATALAGIGFGAFFLLNAGLTLLALIAFVLWASSRPGESERKITGLTGSQVR